MLCKISVLHKVQVGYLRQLFQFPKNKRSQHVRFKPSKRQANVRQKIIILFWLLTMSLICQHVHVLEFHKFF